MCVLLGPPLWDLPGRSLIFLFLASTWHHEPPIPQRDFKINSIREVLRKIVGGRNNEIVKWHSLTATKRALD